MNRFVRIENDQQLQAYAEAARVPLIEAGLRAGHACDEHWLCIDSGGRVCAYGSLWWRDVPRLEQHKAGLIGHWGSATEEGGLALLHFLCNRLHGESCAVAIGPMDGNTWRRYRFVTEWGSEPPFFLEPTNPKQYPEQWRAAGFTGLARYHSSLDTALQTSDLRMDRVRRRLAENGVTLRSIKPAQFARDLRAIYALSLGSFSGNFFYTPIGWEEFYGQYQKLQAILQPEFILMAETDGHLEGFLFAVPDYLQKARGENIDTVVIKTVGIEKRRRNAGLGGYLIGEMRRHALERGYKRTINALMHTNNASLNTSKRTAHVMRTYMLFIRRLIA